MFCICCSGQILSDESIMYYKPNELPDDFVDISFVPVFLIDIVWPDNTTKEEFYKRCNNVTQCVYDYWLTLNEQLADQTKESTLKIEQLAKEAGRSPNYTKLKKCLMIVNYI